MSVVLSQLYKIACSSILHILWPIPITCLNKIEKQNSIKAIKYSQSLIGSTNKESVGIDKVPPVANHDKAPLLETSIEVRNTTTNFYGKAAVVKC